MLNTKEDMTRGIVCAGINIKYKQATNETAKSNSILEKITKQNCNFTS